MRFLKINIQQPVKYISGGRFVTEVPWIHPERTIDSYELIISINETLYIEQDGIQREINPGETFLLLPDMVHRGFKICNKHVSFYWFHFLCSGFLISDHEVREEVKTIQTHPEKRKQIKEIYIPQFDSPYASQRINILCNQLLHVDNSNYHTFLSMHYLMTSLLIELSEQTLSQLILSTEDSQNGAVINHITEWIRMNALEGITVSDVATKFNYHKDYLSRLFKKKTGITVQAYIHAWRIAKAKDLLTRTSEPIKNISNQVGVADEKYFMRLFKKYEKVTPSEYRKAYNKIHYNNH
ncbi:AraC family transcriptional regulator [Lederbergia sp. NSJ-179]|uniref:helix-turn-helix transcriptional regulator n=1 Tax=Lederbergia sp. NSJ-179 TaxID=2931402 RepID=UPI001FD1C90B|nr:AraC family transcriptional regulator [Lederbergia sp. NSJ-179]MCJ7842148.1 AraC family transcriptional regulator [Lederbergia sp. NSJ-179]